jgi:hypothetical protein
MEETAVLFTNEAFYLAFSQRDFEAMERLWATERPVVCIHPGWSALTERAAVLASWRRILENPATTTITPHYASAFMYGDVATVVCYEEVRGILLVATNAFVIEGDAIRIVHHHASACANPPPPETKQAPALQ